MSLRRASLAAVALAVAAALGCTSTPVPFAGARYLQPEDVAVFVGRTVQDPVNLHPYIVVANATRNDLSLVDAVTGVAVPAPIQLQTLAIHVPNRPARLVTASLGDDPDPTHRQKADLLVAVSGGTSVLQVVETWNAANAVDSDPAAAPRRAVDLGHDVIAIAAVPPDPSAPGTARVAVALADRLVAIVTYVRGGDGESIELAGDPAVSPAPLPFQPLDIAVMPDDPTVDGLQTALEVATLDPVAPGVYGAAEISFDLSTVRALGARGPTRLVAAARLQERYPASAASDGKAFSDPAATPPAQPLVPRVYAVLAESGCGPSRPIDCGIVVLDPTVPSGTQAIPPDYAGLMPYRAPLRIPGGRALRIAASGPPEVPPPKVVPEEPDWGNGLMRLYMGTTYRATTAVGAVASDDGYVYYLDLGRFELATTQPAIQIMGTGWPLGAYANQQRLWMEKLGSAPPSATCPECQIVFAPDVNPASAADPTATSAYITVTPGFTPDETWSITWQGILPDLSLRGGEAGELAPGQPWIALQVGDGPQLGTGRIVNDVVQLWHPTLGVKPSDLLVIKAAAVPGCVGNVPPNTLPTVDPATVEKEFELAIGDLVPPTTDYPGGAVSVVAPPESTAARGDPARETWECWQALAGAATGTNVVTGLRISVRAQGLVVTGAKTGYAGRQALDTTTGNGGRYELTYLAKDAGGAPLDEDQLAALCPLADWDGSFPAPACDAACRTSCEQLVLARKARRLLNLSVDCSTSVDATARATCASLWPANTFPIVNGPAVAFQVGVQTVGTGVTTPVRDMAVGLSTGSGILPLFARGLSTAPFMASGMISYDLSAWNASAGYRFLVAYPANFALDTTPSQWPPPSFVVH